MADEGISTTSAYGAIGAPRSLALSLSRARALEKKTRASLIEKEEPSLSLSLSRTCVDKSEARGVIAGG